MSNETQQTGVEWYHQQIVDRQNGNGDSISLDKIYEQAKEIGNLQMMQCYSDGLGNGIEVGKGECSFESVADEKEYLIRTYGGNK
jgi:hypothetical protein